MRSSSILVGMKNYFRKFGPGWLWIASWLVLYILDGLIEKYIFGAGAGGTESLGPVMLLALPLFVIVGIADEIRYRIKLRKLKETGQQKIST
jgi:hypothetical protein